MARTLSRSFGDFDLFPYRAERLLGEMMRGVLDRPMGSEASISAWMPSMEIYEADNEILVEAELPGIQPNDIDIRVENNVLTIRGERKVEEESNRGRAHRQEFAYGTFVRSIALPATIDQEKVQAELKDGILRIHLPKTEKARARQIQIQDAGKAQRLPTSTGAQARDVEQGEPVGAGASGGTTGKRR